MDIHPQFIGEEGNTRFAVLPIREFQQVIEALEDYRDLQDLRQAKDAEGSAPSASLEDVLSNLGLDHD